ncbi:uncharacterized protein LOC135512689 isoform X2 [Oncorhynchus masou masou]|uniref:uncharacterized protein LOC135512689 isoform X2 n=1 Tax=Oncorhynchus masou masou TaxID=90313 RepID=UPI0031832BCE
MVLYLQDRTAVSEVNLLVRQQTLEHSHAIEEDGGSWKKKCISFLADGASVNMGYRGGVIAHLQREAGGHITPIHCMPHRLELAILTIQKKEPKVSVVYVLLNPIWKTYHFSGKSKTRALCFRARARCGYLHTPRVKGTRWVPHIHRALKVFLQHGQDKDVATDECQYSVVLQHLAIASKTAEVQWRAKKGITLKGNLKGFTDLTNPQLKQHVEVAINMGVDDLKARFGSLLKDEGVQIPVESFRVLNPDTWPGDQASLLTFGEDGVCGRPDEAFQGASRDRGATWLQSRMSGRG